MNLYDAIMEACANGRKLVVRRENDKLRISLRCAGEMTGTCAIIDSGRDISDVIASLKIAVDMIEGVN